MKKTFLFIVFAVPIVISSFAQTYPKKMKNDMLEARDQTRNIFIELNDGTVLTFEKLKIKAGIMQYESFYGDGKKLDISFDSVKCYQTEDYYAVRKKSSPKFKIGKIPSSELFTFRLQKGKIELFYSYQQYNEDYGNFGERNSYLFFRKDGNGFPSYIGRNAQDLSPLLSDRPTVSDEFHGMSNKKRSDWEDLSELINKYNSATTK